MQRTVWTTAKAGKSYRHKLVDTTQILADWYAPFGGIAGREVLEFGCGEGTMALGMALQHSPARVAGVEVLDVYRSCLPLAQQNLDLPELPAHFHLEQIAPGQDLSHLGKFDFVYSWSVFEHVAQELLETALRSVARVLKPGGVFMLQISPLYFSAFGSHLGPWIADPWAHLSMQQEGFRKRFFAAPETTPDLIETWSVYLPPEATAQQRRGMIWEVYDTLNKVTAPELERQCRRAGFQIVRDYRTTCEHPIPDTLVDIYSQEVLLTEQVAWLLQASGS